MAGITEVLPAGASCLPGDTVLVLGEGAHVVAGTGLTREDAPAGAAAADAIALVATVAGVVRREFVPHPAPSVAGGGTAVPKYSVVSPVAVRYRPRRGDTVVGVVVRVVAQCYSVHVGAAHPANLDVLAFDGATKQNRRKLAAGDLVFAHVTAAPADAETEISCASPPGMTAKDWVTGEGVYGPLKGGAVVDVPLEYAAELLRNQSPVLLMLGERLAFQAAVGVNGRVWLATRPGEARQLVAALDVVKEARADATHAAVAARVAAAFPTAAELAGAAAPAADAVDDDDAAVVV